MRASTYARIKRACEQLGEPISAAVERLIAQHCDHLGIPEIEDAEIPEPARRPSNSEITSQHFTW